MGLMAPADPAVIDHAGLGHLIDELRRHGYRVVGPTVSGNAIVLAELSSAADLPSGWGVDVAPGTYRLRPRSDRAAFGHSAGPQSWKQFLHPPKLRLFSVTRQGSGLAFAGEEASHKPLAFFACSSVDRAQGMPRSREAPRSLPASATK
jgi:hypothetical protein